jgi:hypothetical protein
LALLQSVIAATPFPLASRLSRSQIGPYRMLFIQRRPFIRQNKAKIGHGTLVSMQMFRPLLFWLQSPSLRITGRYVTGVCGRFLCGAGLIYENMPMFISNVIKCNISTNSKEEMLVDGRGRRAKNSISFIALHPDSGRIESLTANRSGLDPNPVA